MGSDIQNENEPGDALQIVQQFPQSMSTTKMKDLVQRPIFARFIVYIFYRLIRSIILLESDFYLLMRKIFNSDTFKSDKTSNSEVELMTILARRRFYPSDVARDVDFLLFHSDLASFSVLDDPKWQIYSINDKHAFFVEMPFGISEYSFKFCDSLNEAQFAEAQRVARVPWDKFIQKCDKNWQFKGGLGKFLSFNHKNIKFFSKGDRFNNNAEFWIIITLPHDSTGFRRQSKPKFPGDLF